MWIEHDTKDCTAACTAGNCEYTYNVLQERRQAAVDHALNQQNVALALKLSKQDILPEIPDFNPITGLVEQFAVYDSNINQFVIPLTGKTLMRKSEAKALATKFNEAMKPEFQNYTVVTVTFNPEI